ncbi:hypothetical protein HHK36_002617 [Tetracentron sinense]|uniref:Filament-like plant protein 7 n=1 Tax=Tetracentron sinense TaxID=13715 RepID=A0A834ZR46_TETSI|nr:hypothetical protein HHK36_002617 [Tetracentron sinense]
MSPHVRVALFLELQFFIQVFNLHSSASKASDALPQAQATTLFSFGTELRCNTNFRAFLGKKVIANKSTTQREIMDHKTWLWRKKSSEKTIVTSDKVNLSLKGYEEETILTVKEVELERSVKDLNQKLSSALSECNTKDDLVKKHVKMAQEAVAEAVSLKQELDEALKHRNAAEERSTHLDAALRECMQQLRFVREEQEQRIHDAVMKTSREFEKARMVLEEKLTETSKRLAKLEVENTHLSKALQVKEKLIEDLSDCKSQAEADFNALMTKLDSIEKNNASLKYEVCMLEKELQIRNEEREFNRRSADAAHKQHLESVKKIAKLETECQRLRLMVRKRLPGPAALVKMKNEVEMLGRDQNEMRRRKMNHTTSGLMVKDLGADRSPGTSNKKINFLIEQLCTMEEENKTLKETLTIKNNEIKSSRIMCARAASRLSQAEAQIGELSKGQTTMELARISPTAHELSLASISDFSNEDEVSCAESWASALISELEHFRNGKPKPSCKSVEVSDISLMNDFVEMEKLAIVSVDKPFGSSHVSLDENSTSAHPLYTNSSLSIGKELVPVVDSHSGFRDTNQEIQSKDVSKGRYPSWLQDILRVVWEQNHVTQRSPDEILEEIRIALAYMNNSSPSEVVDARESSNHSSASDPIHISGYISWRLPNTSPNSFDGVSGMNLSSMEISTPQSESNLSRSICKIVELIEGINLPSSMDYNTAEIVSENDGSSLPYKKSATPTGYMVRVFQWKSSELSTVLLQFIHTCNALLNGKADLEIFAREITTALDWIMNHCFSLQDVSSMRDTIKKHFNWDESRSESELEIGMNNPFPEADKVCAVEEQSSCLPSTAASNGQNNLSHMGEVQFNLKEENRRLKDELAIMESAKKDLEGRLQSATDKSGLLMIQLQESEHSIASLHRELETLKESKGKIEYQIESHNLMDEDLDTQLSVARVELNEARQKFSSLEVELEDKSNCCEELEATCLELQLQLESVTKKEMPMYEPDQEEKQLRTDWEITAASEKLAECQETILSLGKQLKALASPREAALFDKVISSTPDHTPATTTATSTTTKNMNQRSSLLDQMLAEDDAEAEDLKYPKTKEIICTIAPHKPPTIFSYNYNSVRGSDGSVNSQERYLSANESKYKDDTAAVGALAIVPSKKRGGGGGLLRKLLLRRKRGSCKKTSLPIFASHT